VLWICFGFRICPTQTGRSTRDRPSDSLNSPRNDRSNDSTFCGDEFAWARTDVLACTRICALVIAAVSSAKSASRMALSLAVTFSSATDRLFTFVSSTSFCSAPSRPRSVATCRIAAVSTFCAWIVLPPTSELDPPLDSDAR
jgi:hypothetical protein